MKKNVTKQKLEKLRGKLETLYLKGRYDEAIELSRMLDPILVEMTREKTADSSSNAQPKLVNS